MNFLVVDLGLEEVVVTEKKTSFKFGWLVNKIFLSLILKIDNKVVKFSEYFAANRFLSLACKYFTKLEIISLL